MLYLCLFDTHDLRDRWPGSTWLVYAAQAFDQAYTADDTVLLSEWYLRDPLELARLMRQMRAQGARVIYVGSGRNESETWKRLLASLGVYDWLFVPPKDAEINLGALDALLAHPRTMADPEVAPYLALAFAEVQTPDVVDLLDPADGEGMPETAGEESQRRVRLPRMPRWLRERETVAVPAGEPAGSVRRVVWQAQKPVRVAVVGDAGAGKTYVCWNLAALCNRHDMPCAVAETDTQTLAAWAGADGVHVYPRFGRKGYRVWLETQSARETVGWIDLWLVVTFPDAQRIERWATRLREWDVDENSVLWIVNRHDDGVPLPYGPPFGQVLTLPHEVRQMGAVRLQTPLADTDARMAARLLPVVQRFDAVFLGHVQAMPDTKGGVADVAVARTASE